MPCIFDVKPEDRHCQYCTATICDEREPKQVETFTTNKIEWYNRQRKEALHDIQNIPVDEEKLRNDRRNEEPDLSNVERTIKDWKEEPVSNNYSALLPCIYNRTLEERVKYCKYCSAACEGRVKEPVSNDLEDAASSFARKDSEGISNPANFYYTIADKARIFKAGANWQKTKLMANATEVTVHIDAGGYPYIPQMELYDYDRDVPLAKEGDKYKVILIKEN